MLTHSECLNKFDLNIKAYCTSKHAKRRNSGKRSKIKTENKLTHKYKKQRKKSTMNNLDVIDKNNTKNYNLLYLQKFSNFNHQHVKSKDYRSGSKFIRDTLPYNKHLHHKCHNLESKHIYGLDDYITYDEDEECWHYLWDYYGNWRNCHRVENSRNFRYIRYWDIPYCQWLRQIRQRQFAKIEQLCNWNNIRLSAAKRYDESNKYQILLILNDRSHHLLFNINFDVLVSNPIWFRDWIIKQWRVNHKRYRKECLMKGHIYHHLESLPINNEVYSWEDLKEKYVPPICKGCKLYCCKSCVVEGYCKDCAIDLEFQMIYKCLLSIMDGFDAGIVRILTKYAMGRVLYCRLCGKEGCTESRFGYNKIGGKRKCRTCRYYKQLEMHIKMETFENEQTEEISWESEFELIPVRYNVADRQDIKKYKYRYSSRGFSAFLKRTEKKLPIKSRKSWLLYPYCCFYQSRKIKNALFINNFDILGGETHLDLTNLLLSYGDLEKHVYIKLDCNDNPFAIVQFVNDSAAEWCMFDGIKLGQKELNISWLDQDINIDDMQYDEDQIVNNDFDTNIIDGKIVNYDKEDIKLYNKSKRARERKYEKQNKRTNRKEKFGKNKSKNQRNKTNRKWKDKKMNKRSNKRLLNQCCKIVLENINRNNYIDYISF